eukprot:Tamp_16152.p1 GENE.Tamp_16152~~Tamp_16152.p1  ORF type:complete len:327 (+),score=74.61 Tamp_16152:1-981(+)
MSRARRSTSWQVGGEAMHSLLYPVCNEREAMRRQGLQPKDHAKENVRRIQDLQRQKAQMELQRPQTDPEPFKMQRFKDTSSQVRRWIQEEGYLHQQGGAADGGRGAMPTQRPASAGGYIRKGEGQRRGPSCRESMLEVRGIADVDRRQKMKVKPAVPTRHECQDATPDRPRAPQDYVTRNALAAIRPSTAPGKPSAARPLHAVDGNTPAPRPGSATKHQEFGKVPSYLLKRKEAMLNRQQQVHERLKEHPTDCPEGMRLMKESDRLQTLGQLEESRLKLLKALADMPLLVDTLALQRQKTALETRLSDVEKAIRLYSRSRVFVRDS